MAKQSLDPVSKFKNSLETLCPSWPQERFLVAYSGGLDSAALLFLSVSILDKDKVAAAHLNHQLRGEAAKADQDFAARTADELGITFITAETDVAALAARRGKGVEEAARLARYQFLESAAEQFGAGFILTAHQADDQAETMLMNFIRGAGAGGLAGIHSRRRLGEVELLRPLLAFSRDELHAYLVSLGRSWVEDLSNNDDQYRRNDLRLNILPRLKEINPRLVEALGRASVVMRSEEDFWQNHLKRLWPDIVITDDEAGNTLLLDRTALEQLTLAERRRFIYEAFLKVKRRSNADRQNTAEPMAFATVEIVLEMMNHLRHKGLDLPGGVRAELAVDSLKLSPASRFVQLS